MASRAHKQQIVWEFRTGKRALPTDRFERVGGNSPRVRCVLCGATGFGTTSPRIEELTGTHWQIMCLTDHPVACRCGLSFRTAGHLRQHVGANHYPERALMHGPMAGAS